ncbi:serine/threonine-protein kinase [Mycobacterium bourgelatii]|uniref:non-specific serine/threonine protein kinase n=1 Tax=Mycobacterium bourgelatii TaxID=1273442 RepID=A0A7I9YU96_MYCBU|nr:serine/threonine-protein kinase [Mycobacterium bourgelatii]MCV6977277.1 serine/threonine protein kinase [Mycobacterium bourgelatii]GFG92133.1 hypothetical protein MBOU_41750 [Mycobacterium bourgelatii]
MGEAPGVRSGSMFGPYRLKRRLGHGGMGEVYEAEHTVKEWTVAVKLMSEAFSQDPVFRERMKREARIAGRLQEPHVVPIHDYGEIDGQMFLEMRLILGTDLDKLLKRSGPMPPPRAVAILTQIASALDAAHAAGVMHRDVKPPNILVTRDDFAYLVDFGIASATTDEKITQLGTAVGTWKYMAPERFTKDEVTYTADVYSLACVLYECVTGGPPYQSDNHAVLVSSHMIDPIPRPSAKNRAVPRALDDVVARGMAKKPEDRYPTAGDLMRAAHDALSAPDQNQAATILRRSQEAALPKGLADPPTVQQRRGPSSGPPGAGATTPVSPPTKPVAPPTASAWEPGTRPVPTERQPATPPNTPPPSHSTPPRPTPYPNPPQRPSPPPPPSPMPPPVWDSGRVPMSPPPQPFANVPAGGPAWTNPNPPAPVAPEKTRNPWAIVAGAAAAVLVLIIAAIGIWAVSQGEDEPSPTNANGPSSTTTTTTTTTTTRTTTTTTSSLSAAEARLMRLLPAGYPSSACTPDESPMPGAIASVKCTRNTDANGPTVSAYGLYSDAAGVKKAFANFTTTFNIQECPGGKASPGNWWHTADPNTILGQIACGMYKGSEPQVMWSNEQTFVFGLIAGEPQGGPDLDGLYQWWAKHS